MLLPSLLGQRRRYCGRRRLCVCLSVRPAGAATARRNAALVSAAKVVRFIPNPVLSIVVVAFPLLDKFC